MKDRQTGVTVAQVTLSTAVFDRWRKLQCRRRNCTDLTLIAFLGSCGSLDSLRTGKSENAFLIILYYIILHVYIICVHNVICIHLHWVVFRFHSLHIASHCLHFLQKNVPNLQTGYETCCSQIELLLTCLSLSALHVTRNILESLLSSAVDIGKDVSSCLTTVI